MIKHVVIVTSEFPPGPGGIGNHAFCLAKNLSLQHYRVTVVAPYRLAEATELAFDRHQIFEIVRVPNTSNKISKYYGLWRLLRAYVRKNETLIIGTGMFMVILTGLLKRLSARFVFIAIAHGIDINPSQMWLRKSVAAALVQADVIVAVSRFTASKIPAAFHGKTVVINNGYDDMKLEGVANSAKLPGHPALVTVGTLSLRKGQLNVIKVLPAIIETFPEAHYHMIGLPDQAARIRDLAHNLGVEDHITIHGVLDDHEMARSVAGADVFVMLSGHTPEGDFEGFGIAIIEANHMGIPAIGSNHSGITDAISHGYSGYTVNADSAEEVTGYIKQIMNNYPTYSMNARLHAEKFRWNKVVQQYTALINSLT